MKFQVLTVALLGVALLATAQNRTVESATHSTSEILRSADSGVAEVNRIVGKATKDGLAVAVMVADEALRTVEALMPTIVRIGQQTERIIEDAERTLDRVTESAEFKRAEIHLGEAVKRLEAAAAELGKVDASREK